MTRIGAIADVHANLPALDAVLDAFHHENVERIICCGDLVGCGPWPEEVVQRLCDVDATCVRGNHDEAIFHLARYAASEDAAVRRMLSWTLDRLTDERREFLKGLPDRHDEEAFALVHGSFRAPMWEYILDPDCARASFERFSAPLGLVGHSHLQSAYADDGSIAARPADGVLRLDPGVRYVVNPGSVGMPRDGDRRAAYAIIDLDAGRPAVRFGRAAYDTREIDARMRELGFNGICSLAMVPSPEERP